MATILQPKTVVRFDPNDKSNQIFGRGKKWHLRRDYKTACGEILAERETEEASFCDVNPKDLCALCFRGLEIQ